MPSYIHSKDYLIEFAQKPSTQGWLKDLIIKTVYSNGSLSDDDIETITAQLKENSPSTLELPNSPVETINSEIQLLELEHKGGVCALAINQKIIFSNHITLLYGKNGSGKSSYFRILNEIVGGNHKIDIIPNIYKSTAVPIDVNLKYIENGEIKTYHWDGVERAVFPLNMSNVFDTWYTNTFLDKRSAEAAIVYPYGLHLFTVITSAMDNIRNKLLREKDDIIQRLPKLEQENLSDEVKIVLDQQIYGAAQKNYIEERYEMSGEQKAELSKLEEKLKNITETNYDDKIKITNSEKESITSLKSYLDNAIKQLSEFHAKLSELYEKLKVARSENEKVKAKIQVLGEIGNTDSPEWKQFIIAGNKYVKRENIEENICPYCRQTLVNQETKAIIIAYKDFLEDQSEKNLTVLIREKEHIYQEVQQLNIEYPISEQLSNILNVIESDFYNKKTDVFGALESLSSMKALLIQSFKKENIDKFDKIASVDNISKTISFVCSKWNDKLKDLYDEKEKRDSQITTLKKAIMPLLERKSISQQRTSFEQWFLQIQKVKKLDNCIKELSTKIMSNLAKRASNELITENLKNKFQEELQALKLTHLQVELSGDKAARGQAFMKISIQNNSTDIRKVLSEGEQKGVALALFLAERRMQRTSTPIILDDPVNSLDHYITSNLMDRITQLGSQVIIFSHNILLQTSLMGLNCLHLCGVNQRSSCLKNNQHLYAYKVISQGKNNKGVIIEWKQDNVANCLQKALSKLNETPFMEIETVCSCLRRAIEKMIDERIFKNLEPLRYHGKKNNIPWDKLKTLHADANMIDNLKNMYSRLSGGELHIGVESEENSLEYDELMDMYNKLKTM